jgi:hypothetical protein
MPLRLLRRALVIFMLNWRVPTSAERVRSKKSYDAHVGFTKRDLEILITFNSKLTSQCGQKLSLALCCFSSSPFLARF